MSRFWKAAVYGPFYIAFWLVGLVEEAGVVAVLAVGAVAFVAGLLLGEGL